MLLKDLAGEYIFNCQCRKLSKRTVHNYELILGYLLDYLSQEHGITELEQVKPQMIKQFMMSMQKKGRKPQYINDLLKVFKCFFRYLFDEGYTDTIITERVKNIKEPKVIIKTFTDEEVKDILCFQAVIFMTATL
ncbi:MAG: site-specific integrase [Clostridiales bacterium]|nr:site-specific integrase [Clostridiales bacterium]